MSGSARFLIIYFGISTKSISHHFSRVNSWTSDYFPSIALFLRFLMSDVSHKGGGGFFGVFNFYSRITAALFQGDGIGILHEILIHLLERGQLYIRPIKTDTRRSACGQASFDSHTYKRFLYLDPYSFPIVGQHFHLHLVLCSVVRYMFPGKVLYIHPNESVCPYSKYLLLCGDHLFPCIVKYR